MWELVQDGSWMINADFRHCKPRDGILSGTTLAAGEVRQCFVVLFDDFERNWYSRNASIAYPQQSFKVFMLNQQRERPQLGLLRKMQKGGLQI